MRESVLRDLAERAATNPEFLRHARRDLEGTLSRYGYDLTPEEFKVVEDLRRRTSFVGTRTLAAMLAGGLRKRSGGPPARPAAPDQPGAGRSKPAAPGRRSGSAPGDPSSGGG